MIEYIDVHKAFDVPVLSGVSLSVATRETLSIVGPSGTGKSVLLKTTNGLLVPDWGDVRIDGVSVYHSDHATLSEIRRKVGYVFQYAALFDSMNVFENLVTGLPDGDAKRARSRGRSAPIWSSRTCPACRPSWGGLNARARPAELHGHSRRHPGLEWPPSNTFAAP